MENSRAPAGDSVKPSFGLIAREVEALIPELVSTDSSGYKALAYDMVVPVLVEAIKDRGGRILEKMPAR